MRSSRSTSAFGFQLVPEESGEEVSPKPLFTRGRLAILRVVNGVEFTNECQNLTVIKPQSMSPRTLVEFDGVTVLRVAATEVDDAKRLFASRTTSIALATSTRLVQRLREVPGLLSGKLQKHLQLTGVQPGTFALDAVIYFDSLELESHERFFTSGAHSNSFTSNEV